MTLFEKFTGISKYVLLFNLVLAFSLATNLQAQEIDLLIKGGHVIDPKNEIDSKMDIAIVDGKIFRVADDIPRSTAKKTIDAIGLYVTPGLIDLHTHVFFGTENTLQANSNVSLPPDGFTFRSGVTTVVDAGSSGWRNFPLFKSQTIDVAETRILALLNIVGTGMVGRYEEQDLNDMNPVMTAYMIKRLYPEIIVGIKASHYWGDFAQVDRAVEAGKLANVPVMVDFGENEPANSIEELFMQHLRPGDIFTHTYSYLSSGVRESVVNDKGKVKPFIFDAQKRGIMFDVGHGGGAFSFRQAIPSIDQGFLPNTISSDLHTKSMNSGFKDMANLLSKFLAMGMSLEDVVLRSTWNSAKVIGRADLGNLSVGAEADIAVFNLRIGDFGFLDVRKKQIDGTQKLEAELTIRAGKIVWDLNGISASSYIPPNTY